MSTTTATFGWPFSFQRWLPPRAAHGLRLASLIPLGRYAEASDVARLVVFLASDESSFITGAHYRIDGGMGAM